MKYVKISNQTNSNAPPLQAKYCESFFSQLRGLMFTKELPEKQGILLVQRKDSIVNSSIHMMFMYMDLAVIWINNEQVVVDKVLARKWKMAYLPKSAARYVLETGVPHLSDYNVGDKVVFEESM